MVHCTALNIFLLKALFKIIFPILIRREGITPELFDNIPEYEKLPLVTLYNALSLSA
jgi:hypothetical protein